MGPTSDTSPKNQPNKLPGSLPVSITTHHWKGTLISETLTLWNPNVHLRSNKQGEKTIVSILLSDGSIKLAG